MKECIICSLLKPLREFSTLRVGWSRLPLSDDPEDYEPYCRSCGKEKRAEITRLHDSGWTGEEYRLAKMSQGDCCAICNTPAFETGKALSADHSHKTGVKRALLCGSCNSGLGMFKDDPELLRLAATYLEKYSDI